MTFYSHTFDLRHGLTLGILAGRITVDFLDLESRFGNLNAWKKNLCAYDGITDSVLLASGSNILIFDASSVAMSLALQSKTWFASLKPVCNIESDGVINSLFVCSQKRLVFAAHDNGNISIYDLEAKETLFKSTLPESAWALSLSPKENVLAVGCNDHRIHLFRLESGAGRIEGPHTLDAHSHNVPCIDWKDEAVFASASIDQKIKVWMFDEISGTCDQIQELEFDQWVWNVRWLSSLPKGLNLHHLQSVPASLSAHFNVRDDFASHYSEGDFRSGSLASNFMYGILLIVNSDDEVEVIEPANMERYQRGTPTTVAPLEFSSSSEQGDATASPDKSDSDPLISSHDDDDGCIKEAPTAAKLRKVTAFSDDCNLLAVTTNHDFYIVSVSDNEIAPRWALMDVLRKASGPTPQSHLLLLENESIQWSMDRFFETIWVPEVNLMILGNQAGFIVFLRFTSEAIVHLLLPDANEPVVPIIGMTIRRPMKQTRDPNELFLSRASCPIPIWVAQLWVFHLDGSIKICQLEQLPET